jgi:hypothetical protein
VKPDDFLTIVVLGRADGTLGCEKAESFVRGDYRV